MKSHTLLGRIRNNWLLPRVFNVGMRLSMLVGGTAVTSCNIEPTEEIANSQAVISGYKLDESCKGITRDEDGTLVISYTFGDSQLRRDIEPGGEDNNGEEKIRTFNPEEQGIAQDVMDNYLPQTCNIRYELAQNPEDAYLSVFAADLSNYDKENKNENVSTSGYARYPNTNGAVLVMNSEIVEYHPSHDFGGGIFFLNIIPDRKNLEVFLSMSLVIPLA